MLREKYCQQNRANEPEKLKNKLLIGLTDYAKVKKIKNKNGCNNNQTMTSTLFSHLNEQGYKFSIITTGISSHVRFLLEEKGVRLLSLSLLWSEGHPILAVSDITTTVAPLTHRWQRRKKTNCLLHFRVLNLKNFSMNPAMMGSQEQTMMNSR